MTPLRERVADALAYDDECGPGPHDKETYLEDADIIVKLVIDDVVKTLRERAEWVPNSFWAQLRYFMFGGSDRAIRLYDAARFIERKFGGEAKC